MSSVDWWNLHPSLNFFIMAHEETKGLYPSIPQEPQQQQPGGYYPSQPQPPVGQATVTYYPPSGPPQQQPQQLVISTGAAPVIVQQTGPRQSFVCHIVFSCIVTWCCFCPLGLIAFILASKQKLHGLFIRKAWSGPGLPWIVFCSNYY